jgi:FKBP-type peptidyl-prolyl cis-trans isomerase
MRVDDRTSYSVGFKVGQMLRDRLRAAAVAGDTGVIIKGIIDGLDERDPAYPRVEMDQALAQVEARAHEQQAEQRYATDPAFRKLADDNLARSKAVLEQNAEVAGVEMLPNGVQVQEIKPGDGRVIGNAQFVKAEVEVSLADGTLVRATEPGKPQRVAVSQVLPALVEATRGMRVGAHWRIVVPPDQAFGLVGKPPVIGPNQALRYDVQLVDVE